MLAGTQGRPVFEIELDQYIPLVLVFMKSCGRIKPRTMDRQSLRQSDVHG